MRGICIRISERNMYGRKVLVNSKRCLIIVLVILHAIIPYHFCACFAPIALLCVCVRVNINAVPGYYTALALINLAPCMWSGQTYG